MSSFRLIPVLHLPALPGTPLSSLSFSEVLSRALEDGQTLLDAGFTGVIVENFGDAPFQKQDVRPHILSSLSVICSELARNLGFRVGVNVLRNDSLGALAVASVLPDPFIRINVLVGAAWTDQGLVEGQAYDLLMYRRELGINCELLADVMVKHASPAGTSELASVLVDTVKRGQADAVILTGSGTGQNTDLALLDQAKEHLRRANLSTPLLVGSGINQSNLSRYMSHCDGAIVGTYLHQDSAWDQMICADRCKSLMALR